VRSQTSDDAADDALPAPDGGRPTDIVLVGGGHAHVHVLKAFGDQPLAGSRVTLVSRDLMTPYSGMMPGVVCGFYRYDEAHIDLTALATASGARLVHGEAVGLDREGKRVILASGLSVRYDVVSIDVGIGPDLGSITGAAEHGIAVKPIASFLVKLERLRADARAGLVRHVVTVGGGAAGVELVLAVRTRLIADAVAEGRDGRRFAFTLVTAEELLASHNARVRAAFRRILAARGVALHEGRPVAAITADHVRMGDGMTIPADAALVTTNAAAPAWFERTGLALGRGGFLAVGPTLQVISDADVFAAGDCAELIETPREKSGVFAVRAGPPLAGNLRRRARGQAPVPWWPQARHLSLITTGERYVIASRGRFKAEGAWLWTVKDWLDRRWMRAYRVDAPAL
jgi:selenide,water dikinase